LTALGTPTDRNAELHIYKYIRLMAMPDRTQDGYNNDKRSGVITVIVIDSVYE